MNGMAVHMTFSELARCMCEPRRVTKNVPTKLRLSSTRNTNTYKHTHSPLLSSPLLSPTRAFAMGWLIYLAAMPPALIMAMRLLSLVLPAKPAQLVSYYAFAISSMLLMLCCALYGTLVAIPLRLVGYGGLIQWTVARAFKWVMWLCTGVTFRVTGSMKKEGGLSGEDALRDRPAIFVGNHQTWVHQVLWLGQLLTTALTLPAANSTSSCSAACSPNTRPSRPRSR